MRYKLISTRGVKCTLSYLLLMSGFFTLKYKGATPIMITKQIPTELLQRLLHKLDLTMHAGFPCHRPPFGCRKEEAQWSQLGCPTSVPGLLVAKTVRTALDTLPCAVGSSGRGLFSDAGA